MNVFLNKKILVCGGTGSIGSEVVRQLLLFKPKQVRVFARDENRHQELLEDLNFPSNLRSLVGDIRDKSRLKMAMDGVDIVFNAAAMKHISFCEYNPFEAVKTNVYGTQNVIETALETNVKSVITISTDKATEPTSTLGATKLLAEKITTSAEFFKGEKKTIFASVRFGNVLGSRNSILPLVKKMVLKNKPIPITHKEMTRFVMTTSEAVKLAFRAAEVAKGGEIFVLKMPAVYVDDLIRVYAQLIKRGVQIKKDLKYIYVGARTGEKMHEKLLSEHEADEALESKDMFLILPTVIKPNESNLRRPKYAGFSKKAKISHYYSLEAQKLTKEEISEILIKNGLLDE